jgi:hypothetical protein
MAKSLLISIRNLHETPVSVFVLSVQGKLHQFATLLGDVSGYLLGVEFKEIFESKRV